VLVPLGGIGVPVLSRLPQALLAFLNLALLRTLAGKTEPFPEKFGFGRL
jgi:hypothetical protein